MSQHINSTLTQKTSQCSNEKMLHVNGTLQFIRGETDCVWNWILTKDKLTSQTIINFLPHHIFYLLKSLIDRLLKAQWGSRKTESEIQWSVKVNLASRFCNKGRKLFIACTIFKFQLSKGNYVCTYNPTFGQIQGVNKLVFYFNEFFGRQP